jgi:hypothetical protein
MPELLLAAKKFETRLKTSYFGVPEPRLAEFLKEDREGRSNGNVQVSAKMTFDEAFSATSQS